MGTDREVAARYRRRASELREIAGEVKDGRTRDTLITLADDYDRMAVTRDTIEKTQDRLLRLPPDSHAKK